MKAKLDKRTVAALTLPDGKADEFYWCDQLDRFGLRLRRSGPRTVRTWTVQYRSAGATRRMTIGSADVLTPEQARSAARKALAEVDLGQDPQADRSERRDKDKLSFRSVVAEYIEVRRGDIRPATLQHVTCYLARGPYFKTLWGMPLDRITRKDVAAQLVVIARQNGKPTAGQARAALSAFFSWAMKMGLVEQNPVVGTASPKSNPARTRILDDTELAALWNAADVGDFSGIVRLLILLPCRRGEVGGMAWSELDLAAATWTIPAARAKNGRAITLPLTGSALRIIEQVAHRAGRDHLFGRHGARGFSGWGPVKKALDAKLAIPAWTIHDIRRTVATRLSDLGTAPHVVETLLNHWSGVRSGISQVYNRSIYEREVRQALALWEDHIRSLVDGHERRVVVLPARVT
jgi:integrase